MNTELLDAKGRQAELWGLFPVLFPNLLCDYFELYKLKRKMRPFKSPEVTENPYNLQIHS